MYNAQLVSWRANCTLLIVHCTLYIGKGVMVEKAGDYACSNATTSSKVKAS